MLTDNIRRIIERVEAVRKPLLLAAFAAVVALLMATHLNSGEEATRALNRIYNSQPHYEYQLVQPNRPTK